METGNIESVVLEDCSVDNRGFKLIKDTFYGSSSVIYRLPSFFGWMDSCTALRQQRSFSNYKGTWYLHLVMDTTYDHKTLTTSTPIKAWMLLEKTFSLHWLKDNDEFWSYCLSGKTEKIMVVEYYTATDNGACNIFCIQVLIGLQVWQAACCNQ